MIGKKEEMYRDGFDPDEIIWIYTNTENKITHWKPVIYLFDLMLEFNQLIN